MWSDPNDDVHILKILIININILPSTELLNYETACCTDRIYLVKNSLYVTTKHYMRLHITVHLFGTYINLMARTKAFVKHNAHCTCVTNTHTKLRITQQCM